MAQLSDLPNEVILIIIEYLQIKNNGVKLKFYEFGDAHRYAFEHYQSPIVKNLHSLQLTSRRLNRLLNPIIYRDIFVRDYNRYGEKSPFDQFKWSLENNPSLKEHVLSAMIPCGGPWDKRSIYEVFHLFWVTSLKSLTIYDFKDWEKLDFYDSSHVGTSPVKCLRLIECGAHEEALAAVLSWPEALKILYYDVDQGQWAGHYDGEPYDEWTCEAFVRTLQLQKDSLEELIMTRPPLDHEGLFNGPRINLRDFPALKTLRLYHVFMCGYDHPSGLSKCLPPNLEILEVYYDDTDLTNFFWEDEGQPYDTFIHELMRNKRADLPRLHTVTIYTPEYIYDEEDGEMLEVGLWGLREPLAHDADELGIEVNVWIGIGHKGEPKFEKMDVLRSLKISQSGHFSHYRTDRGAPEPSSNPPESVSRASSEGKTRLFGTYTELQFPS